MATVQASRVAGGVDTVEERRRLAVPESTHTLELRQVKEINDRIGSDGVRLSPVDLKIDHPQAAANSQLRRLIMEGSPAFPYLFGYFAAPGADTTADGTAESPGVPLHTSHLRALSKALQLHHHWGL